jgi:hypothetical protein
MSCELRNGLAGAPENDRDGLLRGLGAAQLFGAIAVVLAAVNIFGGFIVTHRMLSMFKKKPVKK